MSNRSATATINLKFQAQIVNTLTNSSRTAANILADLLSGEIPDGINSGQSNRAWCSEDRALASGANETLDLYQMSNIDIGAGTGKDALGQDCLFEEITVVIIKQVTGDGRLQIEPGTTNPLTALGSHTVATDGALRSGGLFVKIELGDSGINLSAGAKNVKFTASGGALTYSIWILGRHDDDESTSSSSLSSTSSSSLSSTSSSLSSSSSS